MRRYLLTLAVVLLSYSCRSTLKPSTPMPPESMETPAVKYLPAAIGDGFMCAADKKGQGTCFDKKSKAWQTLRAAGATPGLKSLVAQASVACAIGSKPASIDNRILCWQPERSMDAIILSGKSNTRLRSLSLQKDQVCALQEDGGVACGPLMGNDSALILTPLKNLRMIRNLRSGEGFSCALRGDKGAIFCWGDNSKGQLGLGSTLGNESEPIAIAGFFGTATYLDTGSRHVCAINLPGEVFCWGDNSNQQLGYDSGERPQATAPQIVRGLPEKARYLAVGDQHSCAQLIDGSVWCWGAAERLGVGLQGGLIPRRVPLPTASAIIVASSDRTCSQLTTGDIFCWGSEPEVLAVPR